MPIPTPDKDASRPQEVFISYAREDKEFVRRLHEALSRRDRKAWVDWEDIRPTEEFMQAIYGAIEGADTFIFVLTPDSLASITCGREIAHAAAHNKRMVPIVACDVDADTVPEALAKLNWIFCRDSDDFEAETEKLILALDTDLGWVRAHTRLLSRAIEWKANRKSNSYALRREDLRAAEQWLAQAGTNKERQPTALQTEYIIASRKAATRRQRITLGAVTFGFVVAIALAVVAWFARREAVAGRNRADGVIRFVQSDLPEKLRPIGRLDLMQDVSVAVDKYYDAMKKAEGESVDTLDGKVWVLVNQGLIDESKGHLDKALAKYRSGLALAEQAQRLYPDSDKALEDTAATRGLIGLSLQSQGQTKAAIEENRKFREGYEKLVARDPSNARWQSQLAVSYDAEAVGLFGNQQSDAALSEYRKACAIREKLVAQAPNDSTRLSELASSHNSVASVLQQQRQFDSALSEHRASQDAFRKLTLIDPRNADWQRNLAWSYRHVGEVLQSQGYITSALIEFRKYSEAMEKIAASDCANAVWQREAADAHYLIASVFLEQNQSEAALPELRKYHASMVKFAANDPTDSVLQQMAVVVCVELASVDAMLKEKGDREEAVLAAHQGLTILAGLEKRGPLPPQLVEIENKLKQIERDLTRPEANENVAAGDPTNAQREAAFAHFENANALVKRNQSEEALAEARKCYPVMVRLATDNPSDFVLQRMATVACEMIAILNLSLKEKGDREEALLAAHQGLTILAGLEKRGPLPPKSIEIRKIFEKIGRGAHF